MKETLVIGTRGSKLALWQANDARKRLECAWPGLQVELRTVKTTGDVTLDKPLHEIGDKAMFTKELETALLDGDIDLCVHSAKDVPTRLPAGCELSAMLPRADARDALVCGPHVGSCKGLDNLAAGSRVGTGSLRRTAQVKARWPHVETRDIRGNVDTRLEKACGADYDAVILAASGLARMGAWDKVSALFDVDVMVPAAGQGAICIEQREEDDRVLGYVSAIDDAPTSACVAAERRVLDELGGSCKVPIGVHIGHDGGEVFGVSVVSSLDGSWQAKAQTRHAMQEGAEAAVAQDLLDQLLSQGARAILESVLEGGLR